ncbi:RagB/SusD family nutrient uptake outer membrane protein [Mucilaginibacter sp. Bleaf8]|uniref:RagB/SusD family nutrient uptake outer membrane protein n=1 Tax=Mucilaginibacter sp. Bleaf8 TaxID=2834430 RepID=UPI001BCAFC36|nr:RagB/SusD family nutrient uptake outer membrane protein [Mucilaginibacter sp. Bleaf8]MBS7565745.1 RagB/SusD family nutrient uptake outer membrane protein [Mucilaginibacter sp. Bleaf8]
MKNLKQNIYKTLSISLLAATAIVAPGCQKSFLEVPQQAQIPVAQFWRNADDANKAVNAIYANLRSWNNIAFAPIAIESLGSDDTEKGSSVNDATYLNQYDDYSVPATEGQLDSFWDGQYQTINLANQVLDNVPAINMDATLKARLLAEAKFIRAYAYFRLVRAFGDVPLRLTVPKNQTEYNMPRTAKAQVWAAIEQDLTDAAGVLPQKYDDVNVGRATKGAALGLHAKVAMYQQKWADVFNYTNQVMGLGYSLLPNYEKVFRLENENSSESLFEVQAAIVPGNADASNSQYSQVQGVRNVRGGGWGFNVPTQNLADSYETGDPRRAGTIIFRGGTTAEGDKIPANTDNAMYNYKSYVPFSLFVSGFNEGAQQNFRVLRYSDVLLMNAEAANELGNTAQALSSLEMVRERARQGNANILPQVTTTDKTELRNAIWRERRSELAMEYDRYFDVIRQGRAAQVFGPKGWKANKNEVWPIPQTEIDLSRGVLTQNPGY